MYKINSIALLLSVGFCIPMIGQGIVKSADTPNLVTGNISLDQVQITTTKTVYVDAQRVLQSSSEGKALQQELLLTSQQFNDDLQRKLNEHQKQAEEYRLKAPAMSQKAQEDESMRLAQQKRALEAQKAELQEKFNLEMARKSEEIMKQLVVVAEELGKALHVDAVVDTKTGTVLWVRPTHNFTTKMVQLMDQQSVSQQKVVIAKQDVKQPVSTAKSM